MGWRSSWGTRSPTPSRATAPNGSRTKLVQLGSMAASLALNDMDYQTQSMVMGALGVGSALRLLLPYSREHESEADYMGLIYTARACYDPTEAPALWQRMGEGSGGRPARYRLHPSPATKRAFGSSVDAGSARDSQSSLRMTHAEHQER